MKSLSRYIAGDLDAHEVRRHVFVESMTFWFIILIAWISYPAEHRYSIMTHTFSFLGSFNEEHNPQFWWFFTIAMFFWGTAMVPQALYLRRRFSAISGWGAWVGAGFFLLGSLGVVFVALFPDARAKVFGDTRWTEIHEKAALTVAGGFALGIPWFGGLVIKDRLTGQVLRGSNGASYWRFVWPYACWASILSVGLYFLIKWESVYAEMKAAAAASGERIGSSWSAAMNTRYSFPLWENIEIYALFAFIMWFTLAVARSHDSESSKKG